MSNDSKKREAGVTVQTEAEKDALIAELKAQLASAHEKLAAAPAASIPAGVEMGTRRAIAKCAIQTKAGTKQNGTGVGAEVIPEGALIPWDVTNPPEGYDLLEGVHYEFGFVADAAA